MAFFGASFFVQFRYASRIVPREAAPAAPVALVFGAGLAGQEPSPLLAQYSTPVGGLYLCGAGTHPGGGVMAAAGHNAAKRILRDRRFRRLRLRSRA